MSSTSVTTDKPLPITPLTREGYRTAPDQDTTGWPPGIPYIIGNEACERFSYYGMRSILYIHLVSLYILAGSVAEEARQLSTSTTHLFMAGVYALPMIGAIIADRLAGKFRTIMYLSLVYCAGQAVLALFPGSLTGMYIGLGLIAVGSGGIKPCVSANVGDQFGKGNWFRVRTVFQIFYFSINFGSFFATMLIPVLKEHAGHWVGRLFPGVLASTTPEHLGASIAFGVPGVLMFLATLIFWMGRKKFVHVPPQPGGRIGLLDTLSSTALFLAFGHLFVTYTQPWWVQVGTTVVFLILGLALFSWRQRLSPDDGFLAVTLYTLRYWLTGSKAPDAAPASVDDRFTRREDLPPPTDGFSAWVGNSPFWRPAVERFGLATTEGPVAVLKIVSIFAFIFVFWALFDQHSSTWIRQAEMMNRTVWEGFELLPSQIPSLNPLMVMILIPLLNVAYALSDRAGLAATPLRRITVGMFITALSFVAVAWLQERIDAEGEGRVSVAWQIIPYLLLTVGEVMVSITSLEFAYTQAPKRMKSTVMGFLMLTVALGNYTVSFVARTFVMPLAQFFWLFAGLMAAAGLLFWLRSLFYVQKDYTQE